MNIEPFGIIGLIGLFVALGVSIYFWERFVFRLIPFVYATGFTLAWFDNLSGSIIELFKAVAVMNIVTGVMLFAAWLQIRKTNNTSAS